MTTDDREFEEELELFRTECESAAQFFYGYLAMHEVARRRKAVFDLFNENPLFWSTVAGALQAAAVITIGRVFDQRSPHNLDRLLNIAHRSRSIFSKSSLGRRKTGGSSKPPPWLEEYLRTAYEPASQDFRRLKAETLKNRKVYDAKYRDLRHKVIAHREVASQAEVAQLFARTNISEFERLFVFLLSMYEALWQLFMNGRKPVLRRLKYSVNPSGRLRLPRTSTTGVHERIVRDTEQVLTRAARPNKRLHPTAARRRGGRG